MEFFLESVGIAQPIGLPDHCSIFQAEEVAIQATAKIIGDGRVPKQNVTIFLIARRLSSLWVLK